MSALLTRSKKSGNDGLVVAPYAQVNLLPNEIVQARSLKTLKRLLVVALLGVVAVIFAAIAAVVVLEQGAQDDLADAKVTTDQLKIEEQKYVEVPRVINALTVAQLARLTGFSTEILWTPYLDAITAVLPEGVSVNSFTMAGSTPMSEEPPIANPLQTPRVNTITFSMRSLTLPDTAALMDGLNSIYGFGDAWVSSAAISQAEDGTVYYEVAASIEIRSTAYANRFTGEVEQ